MKYIKNLASNYQAKENPLELDVVIEGGAFNGLYITGCMLLLKELERKKYLKVNRISGVSIGSVLGLYYFINKSKKMIIDFDYMRKTYKERHNLSGFVELVEKLRITKSDIKKINNKLFITYTKNGKKETINTYSSVEEVKKYLLCSCHLPYITSDTFFKIIDSDDYLDGGTPLIFNNRCHDDKKILHLNTMCNFSRIFNISKEKNCSTRTLEGALQLHKFLMYNEKVPMCSYINDWDTYDFTVIRIKSLMFKISFYLLWFFKTNYNIVKPYLNHYLKDTYILNDIYCIINELTHDLILINCF